MRRSVVPSGARPRLVCSTIASGVDHATQRRVCPSQYTGLNQSSLNRLTANRGISVPQQPRAGSSPTTSSCGNRSTAGLRRVQYLMNGRQVAQQPLMLSACVTVTSNGLNLTIRGVAQSGSAPGSGPGGRRFESSRPDHHSTLFDRLVSRIASVLFRYRTPGYHRVGLPSPK